MKRFSSILLPLQGKNKSALHWLYNTRDTRGPEEPEKIFSYGSLQFWFCGTSFRNSEKLLLYVGIPADVYAPAAEDDAVLYEHLLLSEIAPVINGLSKSYENTAKNIREKAQFSAQSTDARVLRRSGLRFDPQKGRFVLLIQFNIPLVNALSVNAKAALRAVKDILQHITSELAQLDEGKRRLYADTFRRQKEIRRFLHELNACAFIGDGSILPRENGTDAPMAGSVPFCSPDTLRVTIPLSDGTALSGMAVPQGVTVVTGGGYSGKSTLLDAIEAGIYNHAPGDGREYVITDASALKISAEDGRPVHQLDLSPFFRFLPGPAANLHHFSTAHASGSVSQAANIVEAVCGQSRLLLIDEDKSATNFMIRDQTMRQIVKNEPIIPFTDRVRELSSRLSVSTILVIGGSSEYLPRADRVLLMEDFLAKDVTDEVKALALPAPPPEADHAEWPKARRLAPLGNGQPFIFFQTVETEHEKKIILDEYSTDITFLTALSSGAQMNLLAGAMERLLTDKKASDGELLSQMEQCIGELFANDLPCPGASLRWYEEIRPLDGFCAANRLRGLAFAPGGIYERRGAV